MPLSEPTLRTINAVISALFFICYTYQFLYIPLVLLKKRRPLPRPAASHRYAVSSLREERGKRRVPGCWTRWPRRPTICPW